MKAKLSFACLALLYAFTPLTAAPKNIVLIITDDQSPDFGCYGNKVLKTPNLDQLADEGTRFRNAFATTASCSASRSVLLSGMHNHANGQYGHAHAFHKFSSYPTMKSLPVMLSGAGYRSVLIGKLHVEPESVYHFDEVLKANARNPVAMADASRPVIEAKSDKPFFLYFAPADPHREGLGIKDDPLHPNSFGNRPKGFPGVETVVYDPKDVIVPAFLPDTPACRAELAQYYQSVARVDQGVGRLIQILKDTKKYDDTLIIFQSDHGIAFPGAKTTAYDPGLRIPLIVRHPTIEKRGVVNDAMISMVDIMPTVLDFAGALPKTSPLHGRSFLSILSESQPKGWDEIYASHTFHEITMYYPMRVVRDRQYKLLWNIAHPLPFPFASDLWEAATWQDVHRKGPDALYGKRTVKQYIQRPKFELYDIQHDPDEVKNLIDDPKLTTVRDAMLDRLKSFQKKTNDPWISKWNYE